MTTLEKINNQYKDSQRVLKLRLCIILNICCQNQDKLQKNMTLVNGINFSLNQAKGGLENDGLLKYRVSDFKVMLKSNKE